MFRKIIFFFAITLTHLANAQSPNIQTDIIRWSSSGFSDQLSEQTVNAPCEFKTYSDRIEWIQDNGNFMLTLNIQSSFGTWTDLNQDGMITFSVLLDTLPGEVQISRVSGVTTLRLILTGGTSDIKNLYTISSFGKL
jgi:hypothetical protein